VVMFLHGQDFIKHQYHRDKKTFLLALSRDLAFGHWTFDRPSSCWKQSCAPSFCLETTVVHEAPTIQQMPRSLEGYVE
jgi:hypothetical protein